MKDASLDNFVKLDPDQPALVFSSEEIEFINNLPVGFSQVDRQKLFAVEDVLFNKTTRTTSFKILPGLRPLLPGRASVYFSRFGNDLYDDMLEQFFEYPIARLPEDEKYTAVCETFRILTPDNMVFYPVEFGGEIEKTLKLYREAAEILGAKLARFHDYEFRYDDGKTAFPFSELEIGRMRTRQTPPNW